MAMQTFYHLCRLGFLDEDDERVQRYVKAAQPKSVKAGQGIYYAKDRAPFLEVCGQRLFELATQPSITQDDFVSKVINSL